MSDQTPNSNEDLNGSEPSMEDILASIRKIISDDEPVALESPEDVIAVDIVGSDSPSTINNVLSDFGHAPDALISDAVTENLLPKQSEGSGIVDLNIDDVLAGLDDDILSDDNTDFSAMDAPLEVAAETPVEALGEALSFGNDSLGNDSLGDDFETDDDILSFMDQDIPLDGALDDDASEEIFDLEDLVSSPSDVIQEPVSFTEPDAMPDSMITSEDAEMDSLLEEILSTPESEVVDFAPDTLDDIALDDIADETKETLVSQEDSDLELVKSLMADLTDDPDGLGAEGDLDELLAIPDIDETVDINIDEQLSAETALETFDVADETVETEDIDTLLETFEGPATEEDEDILGDILDMTLEDELEAQPDDLDALLNLDDITEAEQENILENALEIESPIEASEIEALEDSAVALEDLETEVLETLENTESSSELPSLSDIAAAAEADAVAVEASAISQPIMGAATAAAAGAGLAVLGAKAAEPEIETLESAQVEADVASSDVEITDTTDTTETPPQSYSNQETSMPVKAVKSDAILDEVTETATAGAFAELNQVVEDKATFNERGPRIGDLVQDALRPMLKEWLDANLKGIVERAVTKEVKRISSGK